MIAERMKLRSLNSALLKKMHVCRHDVHDEKIESERRRARFGPGFRRGEPFHTLAAVKQHLQTDHAERKGRKTEEVEGRALLRSLLGERKLYCEKMKPVIGRLK